VNDYALAALAGVFLSLMLGFVWYSPAAFGDVWLEALGRRPEDLRGALGPMLWSVAALVASGLALALVVDLTGARSVGAGALVGGAAGAVAAGAMLSDYLFCGWPLRLLAVQAGYRVLFLVLMGIVLAARP
jgi:hypothetical protein